MKNRAAPLLGLILAACAAAPDVPAGMAPPPEGSILFLPPLAEMTLVTASGLREEQADWSHLAALNLGNALSGTVPDEARDETETARMLAQDLARKLAGMPPDLAEDSSGDYYGLILVSYDVESSASQLVQTGLGVMFGGMPGPDGIDQSAQLVLIRKDTREPVWSVQVKPGDPRDPQAAKRLIDGLIAASSGSTGF